MTVGKQPTVTDQCTGDRQIQAHREVTAPACYRKVTRNPDYYIKKTPTSQNPDMIGRDGKLLPPPGLGCVTVMSLMLTWLNMAQNRLPNVCCKLKTWSRSRFQWSRDVDCSLFLNTDIRATRGAMVNTSAFLASACHQCYSAGSSLG